MSEPNKDRKSARVAAEPPVADDTQATQTRPNSESGEAGDDAPRPRFGPPAAADEVGTLGRFRVRRELGHGGMGAVYLAFDTQLHRQIALKVMLPHLARVDTVKERFIREARSAAQISHDNVLGILDAGEIDGVPFIAMPHLQGYALNEFLRKKGNPGVPQVMRIGREMALGLAAAHDLGVIHRDIKPGNVFLEAPNGRVKILDFGLAKPAEELLPGKELTHVGQIMGTPAYMAPEQAAGLKVDHRADLYSLGSVLYRLLAGRTPFEHHTELMPMLVALAAEEPRPVRELNPTVSPALADLVHELLRKDRDARPQSAKDVAKRIVAMMRRSSGGEADSAQIELPAASSGSFPTPMQTPFVAIPISAPSYQPPAADNPPSRPPAPPPTPPEPKSRLMVFAWLLAAFLFVGVAAAVVSKLFFTDGPARRTSPPSKKAAADEKKPAAPAAAAPVATAAAGWEDLFPADESPFYRRRWELVGNVRTLAQSGDAVAVDGGGYAWIRTKKEYADYELELEYKPTPGANSGIFLRAPADDAVDLSTVVKIQLADDAAAPDAWPNMLTGSLYGLASRRADPKAAVGTWNTVTVRAVGRRVTATVNHLLCIDEHVLALPTTGRLGLQVQATGLEFRNVRVRELK